MSSSAAVPEVSGKVSTKTKRFKVRNALYVHLRNTERDETAIFE